MTKQHPSDRMSMSGCGTPDSDGGEIWASADADVIFDMVAVLRAQWLRIGIGQDHQDPSDREDLLLIPITTGDPDEDRGRHRGALVAPSPGPAADALSKAYQQVWDELEGQSDERDQD